MGILNSGSIFNPVNQLNKIGNVEDDVLGSSARFFDPMGYAFGDNGHVKGQGVMQQGGALNSALDPLDMMGGQKAGALSQASNFDPNAPGSIFNMQRNRGAAPNLPAPGYATNGLGSGSQSGGIDWAPIIAKALRKR